MGVRHVVLRVETSITTNLHRSARMRMLVAIQISDREAEMDSTAAIRAFIPPWTQACLDRDWDALLAMCTDDVVFSPPGEPQVATDGARAWLEAFPVIKEFNWDFDDIEISGDLAVGVGRGKMIVEAEGQEATLDIKFVDVLRRGDDDSWRFAHIIWNTNDEPAA